jgi:putative tricarboxylic transport membrane protein
MDRQPTNRSRARVADIAFLLCLAVLVALYCLDAIGASTDILNLIFVLPVAVVVLALCLVQLVVVIRSATGAERSDPVSAMAPVIALFTAYVLLLPGLGFDLGTMLFIAAFLWLKGERRWPLLVGYSIGFAIVLTIVFSQLLPYAMPVRILSLFG